jgi:hypothetical protein
MGRNTCEALTFCRSLQGLKFCAPLVQSYSVRIPGHSVNVCCGKSVSGETGDVGESSSSSF